MPPPLRFAIDQLFQPRGDLAAADSQRIRQAFAAALAEEPVADPAALLPAEAVRLLATVGRSLTGDRPRWAAVMALVEGTPDPLRDRLPLRLLWLRAARQLGRHAELTAEFTRLLLLEPADDRRDATLVKLAVQMGIASRLPSLPRLYPLRWGSAADRIATALAGLDILPSRAALSPDMLGYLCQLRGIAPEEAEGFARDLSRSIAAREFLTYLGVAEAHLLQRGDAERTTTETRVLALAAQVTAGMVRSDLTELAALRDAGRSILLLGSHLGTMEPRGSDLLPLGMRIALVRAGVPDKDHAHALQDNPDAIVIRTAGSPSLPFDLLKLAKKLRSEPFLIRICPDGRYGQAPRAISLDGWRIRIGTGAALLGYHAKAQVAFSQSRWTGRDWVYDTELGPDLRQAGSLDEAEDRIAAFYADCLLQALRGPVEDIGGVNVTLAPHLR